MLWNLQRFYIDSRRVSQYIDWIRRILTQSGLVNLFPEQPDAAAALICMPLRMNSRRRHLAEMGQAVCFNDCTLLVVISVQKTRFPCLNNEKVISYKASLKHVSWTCPLRSLDEVQKRCSQDVIGFGEIIKPFHIHLAPLGFPWQLSAISLVALVGLIPRP